MARQKCCNINCDCFNHLMGGNCTHEDPLVRLDDCPNFKEMKAKDPEKPVKPGINGWYVLISTGCFPCIYKSFEKATECADDDDRLFRIDQACEYQMMGWIAGESYQGGVE